MVRNRADDTVTGNLGLGEFISRWNFGSDVAEGIADSEAKRVLVGANPAADMDGAQHVRLVEAHRPAGKAEVQRTAGMTEGMALAFPQGTARTGEPEPPAFRTVEKRKVAVGKAGIAQLGVPNTVALVEWLVKRSPDQFVILTDSRK